MILTADSSACHERSWSLDIKIQFSISPASKSLGVLKGDIRVLHSERYLVRQIYRLRRPALLKHYQSTWLYLHSLLTKWNVMS